MTFRRLVIDKYLTLEVLKFIKLEDAFKFMSTINKHARTFILTNYDTLKNEFINNGLIEHALDSYGTCHFFIYDQLEKQYLEAIKRNEDNRILTIFNFQRMKI